MTKKPLAFWVFIAFSLAALLLILLGASASSGADWYVSPNASGAGTIGDPGSLTTAAAHTGWAASIAGDDTVWIRGGVYSNGITSLTFAFSGTSGHLVTWRAYTNEFPAINQRWRFGTAKYHRFWGLETFDSRKGTWGGNPQAHIDDANAVGANEWINCRFHDVNNCLSGGSMGVAVRGCIFWYVGDTLSEHAMYQGSTQVLDFSGNISAWTAGATVELGYTGITIRSNIMFGSGLSILNAGPEVLLAFDGSILGNCLYETGAASSAIYCNSGGNSFTVNGNTAAGQSPYLFSGPLGTVAFNGNTAYMNVSSSAFQVLIRNNATIGTWTINNNTYRAVREVVFQDVAAQRTFAQWKSANAGYDAASTATDSNTPPDSVTIFPNADEPRRAHIAIYNWSLADNVSVNPSSVLGNNCPYRLYSAQNMAAGPIRTGLYTGQPISVPMTNLTSAPILYGASGGDGMTQPTPTSPTFGAFVLIGDAPSPGTTITGKVTITGRVTIQ